MDVTVTVTPLDVKVDTTVEETLTVELGGRADEEELLEDEDEAELDEEDEDDDEDDDDEVDEVEVEDKEEDEEIEEDEVVWDEVVELDKLLLTDDDEVDGATDVDAGVEVLDVDDGLE